ncbi:FkbM family methyltransferase [Methylobacterium sp. 13MFTsu3.1M2]|uniref:FkbM family methyltransferase n=1 Tax=Methylobacterium sp. 13MFTsu3.1M2 TaxID=1502776 RepID=UPI00147BB345|nr:FkbM family methyltransferase [Methylobacterium sp. 13MFTsu3.1M2]
MPKWFWSIFNSGAWEPHTLALISHFINPEWRFVDIGAWMGPTALFAAAKGGRVDAYECDPEALRRIRTNISINPELASRIRLIEHALSDKDGSIRLFSRSWGGSESSILARHEREGQVQELGESVLVGTRDIRRVFLENGYAADAKSFIKMDIEGAEFLVIPALSDIIEESRCVWHISFHDVNLNPKHVPAKYVRAAEVIRCLEAFSPLIWYSETLEKIDKSQYLDKILSGSGMQELSLVFSKAELMPL